MNAALCFDLESVPLAAALAAPYPKDKRNPPGNYSKPEAIAKWYEKDEAEWKADRSRECALSPRLGRIVAIGFAVAGDNDDGGPWTMAAHTEVAEAAIIAELWRQIEIRDGRIIGFNSLTFDVPFFLFRSMLNGVKPTVPVKTLRDWTRRYSYSPHYDVRAVLTGWDNRTTGTLTDWASCLGIPCDDTTKGSDIHALYQAGDFDAIAEHCRADVAVTKQLYERVSTIYGPCGSNW